MPLRKKRKKRRSEKGLVAKETKRGGSSRSM